MVNLTIDGVKIEAPDNSTVLQAAVTANIDIPTLCYLQGVNAIGSCRMCLVEIVGGRALQAACVMPVSEGMEVKTNSKKVRNARKVNLELILSNHDRDCLTCGRNNNCELQALADRMGVTEIRYDGANTVNDLDLSSPSIRRDPNKCVLCRRCVAACTDIQDIGAIGATKRGFETIIEPVFGKTLADVPCINCGRCVQSCPCGALTIVSDTERVWEALGEDEKCVVVQTAPAVRAALGEAFGMPMGTPVTGKMVTALKRLGFDKVYDTDFAADLTIMEEGTEFIDRLTHNRNLPMITSCSPGWVKYMEHYYEDFFDNMSSCKSPQQMMGAIIKTYCAANNEVPRENIYSVSVMPCSAKKFELQRPELGDDVDCSITTVELADMIKQAGIDFATLPDSDFDEVMGDSTGAGVIFGTTGGVMEAALRTVYEIVTGEGLEKLEFDAIRGMAGVKEATIKVGDLDVKVAVAHGTKNASKLLDSIRAGEKEYHFIEIMACPGGCINGGGQPPVTNEQLMKYGDHKMLRAKALYSEDERNTIRKSHENPSVQKLYEDFLGKPGSHKAHELLHTTYKKRGKYNY
jgi:NADP-reducing hydrogenase subunit HndD